jgi:hypothetical protein
MQYTFDVAVIWINSMETISKDNPLLNSCRPIPRGGAATRAA